jgi:uncharacterized membrane protein
MFAPLAFLLFGWGALMRRGSAAAVSFGFFAFAAVMGVSMSSIFLVFTSFSIVQTFLVTAIAFAGLSLWGYTTKKDLSGMGTFLMMGVIGLLVAMVINIFLQSACDDVRDLGDRHPDLRRPDRLLHAADQERPTSPTRCTAIRNGWKRPPSTARSASTSAS